MTYKGKDVKQYKDLQLLLDSSCRKGLSLEWKWYRFYGNHKITLNEFIESEYESLLDEFDICLEEGQYLVLYNYNDGTFEHEVVTLLDPFKK